MALVAVVHGVHFVDVVEVADDESSAEGFAGLDRPAGELQDEDRVLRALLHAPRLVDDGGFEHDTRQPRALFARLLIAQVVAADEMLRRLVHVASVSKLPFGREDLMELAGRNAQPFGVPR